MNGRVVAAGLGLFAAAFAATLWYFQMYAWYRPVVLVEPQPPQTVVSSPQASGTETAPAAPASRGDGVGEVAPAAPGDRQPGQPATADTAPAPVPETGAPPTAGQPPAAATASGAAASGTADTQPADTTPPGAPSAPEQEVAAVAPAHDPDEAFADARRDVSRIRLQLVRVNDGLPEDIPAEDFVGIDAPTSPIKLRGCFRTPLSFGYLTETYQVYDAATPLKAPSWFDCFDFETLTEDLASGEAIAFLAGKNVADGVDRVIAVYGDGRAYVWQQLNEKYAD